MSAYADAGTVLAVWRAYATPWNPQMPRLDRYPLKYDSLIGLAFGRNEADDSELGKLVADLQHEYGTDLEMVRFLSSKPVFPVGGPNHELARELVYRYEHSRVGKPLMCIQWEIAVAIFQMDPDWFTRHVDEIEIAWPPESGYFATGHVMKWAREHLLLEHGCYAPYIIAHPAMYVRVVMTAWKFGFRPVAEGFTASQARNSHLWTFDEGSVQEWTRSFDRWRKRAAPSRLVHLAMHFMQPAYWLVQKTGVQALKNMIPGNWIRLTPPRVRVSNA